MSIVSRLFSYQRWMKLSLPSNRTYIANFWESGTQLPTYGHYHRENQSFGQHRKHYNVRIRYDRISDIKRLKKYSYDRRMSYGTGRQLIMEKILNDKDFYAES